MNDYDFSAIFLWIFFGIILFFIFRVVAIWYFQIGERIRLQRENNLLLKKMLCYMGDPEQNNLFYINANNEAKKTTIDHVVKDPDSYNKLLLFKLIKHTEVETEPKINPSMPLKLHDQS